jgi:hypothetical protein
MAPQRRVNPDFCKEDVWHGNSFHGVQCSRKPWKDGFCKQHHPANVQARREKRDAQWGAERKHKRQLRALPNHAGNFKAALEKIRDGHNDARGLAAQLKLVMIIKPRLLNTSITPS